jgi:hypothetical protein
MEWESGPTFISAIQYGQQLSSLKEAKTGAANEKIHPPLRRIRREYPGGKPLFAV